MLSLNLRRMAFVLGVWGGAWAGAQSLSLGPAAAKPSLKQITDQLQSVSQIQELFQKTTTSAAGQENAIQNLVRKNQRPLTQWRLAARASLPFQRGEIEEEKVLGAVLSLQQLVLLQSRLAWVEGNADLAWEPLQTSFTFAADLPYEEASLIGLRLAHLLRSLVLDEMENHWQKDRAKLGASDLWLKGVTAWRAPWPIDRVILTESRRLIRDKGQITAQKVAMALQKNAYQTSEQALQEAVGPKTAALQVLVPMWRSDDVEMMKVEITRINALRIHLAQACYQATRHQVAPDFTALIGSHLLDQVPINYTSGQPFTWAEINQPGADPTHSEKE